VLAVEISRHGGPEELMLVERPDPVAREPDQPRRPLDAKVGLLAKEGAERAGSKSPPENSSAAMT
jgi:hypothetical protein